MGPVGTGDWGLGLGLDNIIFTRDNSPHHGAGSVGDVNIDRESSYQAGLVLRIRGEARVNVESHRNRFPHFDKELVEVSTESVAPLLPIAKILDLNLEVSWPRPGLNRRVVAGCLALIGRPEGVVKET